MDDRVDDPFDEVLPSRAVLEAYDVPELPADFTDRVMASMHAPVVTMPPRASVTPWIVAVAATVVAAAAVTVLALRPSPAPPSSPPTLPVATTAPAAVPVAAPPTPMAKPEPAVAPTGDVIVVTVPRDATVRIDGVDMSNASGGSPHVRTKLSTGMHTIEVTREGFSSWQTTVDLPARALELEVVLDAVPPPTTPATPRTPRPAKPSRPSSAELKDPFGSGRRDDRDDAPPRDDRDDDRQDLTDPFASK